MTDKRKPQIALWMLAATAFFAWACDSGTTAIPDDFDDGSDASVVADGGGGSAVGDGESDVDLDGGIDVPTPPHCGDRFIQVAEGENCDDGNTVSGDGCSDKCRVEGDWTCPTPGEPCIPPPVCGDGRLNMSKGEMCDDGNNVSGDGCSADCQLEPGWKCPWEGAACTAALCGDNIVVAGEECDPPGQEGCDDNCRRIPGYACDTEGCHRTVCGDGIPEGDEGCDLGATQNIWGSGCTPDCQVELACNATSGSGLMGPCNAVCGSGMMLSGDTTKACDDGNLSDGDGCSSTCEIEAGWTCAVPTGATQNTLSLPIIFRDFIGKDRRESSSAAPIHPDFNIFNGSGTRELVQEFLDSDGKPAFQGISGVGSSGNQLTDQKYFRLWYRDEPLDGVTYSKQVVDHLTLTKVSDSPVTYQFESEGFFPLDNKGWMASGDETVPADAPHNYSFTSEIHYWFEFQGGETLAFYGDDDLWVFVNGKLALDLGGLHSQQRGQFTIKQDGTINTEGFIGVSGDPHYNTTENFGLIQGKLYEIAIFHAERMQTGSNYKLTLAGFNPGKSICTPICGDGLVVKGEICDDGAELNTGAYGRCLSDCSGYGPRCGDGIVDAENGEMCDEGLKNGTEGSTCTAYCTTSGGGGFN